MKKLIFLILLSSVAFAQSGNPLIDSLSVHRTVLDSLGTQVSNLGLTTGMTMTGDIILEDDVKLKLGDSGADGQLFSDGTESFLQSLSKNLKINATGAYNIYLGTGATYDWQLDSDGNFFPTVNQTYDIGDATHEVDSIYAQDITASNSIVIGDANITETELEILDGATVTTDELNILDGVTATASEINKLDGLTATVGELNYTDGVTSNIQTQIDGKQAVVAGVSSTEIGYLDGVTSAIQTQLDAKVTTASIGGQIQDSIEAQVNYVNMVIVYPQTNNELIPILLGNKQITELYAVIQEGTSVSWDLYFSATMKDGSGNSLLTDAVTTSYNASNNVRTDHSSAINDTYEGDVEENHYVWIDIGTVTGAVKSLTVTLGVIEGD